MTNKKFATIIFEYNGKYYIDDRRVLPGNTTESTRDQLLAQHLYDDCCLQRFVGIVRVEILSETCQEFYYHFIYHVYTDINDETHHFNKTHKTGYQNWCHNYILSKFIKQELHYHEIQYSDSISLSPIDLASHDRSCVLIGSYRKHLPEMQTVSKIFEDAGVNILSPRQGIAINPSEKFVLLDYDPKILTEGEIQTLVLKKMDKATFTYLVNPGGYLGSSAAFEVGYAVANNIKIFCMEPIQEMHQHFIRRIYNPIDILENWNKMLGKTFKRT